MPYLARAVDTDLDELLRQAPAVALEGPKAVGKTATARRRSAAAWFLDQASQRDLLDADGSILDSTAGTVLFDEWQRLPQIWDVVRRAVDDGAPPGRFLLTGSATPIIGTDTHSGAGRILSVRMRPMALYERAVTNPMVSLSALVRGASAVAGSSDFTLAQYARQIVASGFPGITRLSGRLQVAQLDGYLQRVVDRDLPDQGLAIRRPETLRRWLSAYAAATSTTTGYATILDSATAGDGSQPAKTTTIAYRDHLTQLWLLDPVPGWSPSRNPFARLQQAPKHQLADPALAARLLNLTDRTLLTTSGAAMVGPLFEALATLTVRAVAQNVQARVGHLRTRNGDHEVDLIVEGNEGQILGIEVKLASTITDADVRHLHWLRDRGGSDVVDLIVINTGSRAYRRRDGVAVVPLALLGG